MALKSGSMWVSSFMIPFCIDRLTKYVVLQDIVQNQDITSFLEIYLTYNRGISWGIASTPDSLQFTLVSLLVAAVLSIFVWYIYTHKMNTTSYVAALYVLAGAVSNFLDRLLYGGVVDFIRFHYSVWSFPVFNVADVFITLGTFVLVWFHVFDESV